MANIDPSKYTVAEIREALAIVDRVKHPENAEALERELASRPAEDLEVAEPKPGFWSRIDWIRVITWYLLIGGAYLVIVVVIGAIQAGFGAFSTGDIALATGGAITLTAGELMRRDLEVGKWLAAGILAPQIVAFTSSLAAFKYQLLGGVYFSVVQAGVEWTFNFWFSIGDPDVFLGSGLPVAFSINLLAFFFLLELIESIWRRARAS